MGHDKAFKRVGAVRFSVNHVQNFVLDLLALLETYMQIEMLGLVELRDLPFPQLFPAPPPWRDTKKFSGL